MEKTTEFWDEEFEIHEDGILDARLTFRFLRELILDVCDKEPNIGEMDKMELVLKDGGSGAGKA